MCRSGDLVARYGGEEFAILCADCTNAAAARKAEAIRKALSRSQALVPRQRSRFTASFGVTELQTGDTPETMLRRADRALLQAKDQGRNQVVQLGDGMMEEKVKRSWWPFQSWRGERAGRSDAGHDRADRSGRAEAPRLHRRPGRQDRQDERQRAAA